MIDLLHHVVTSLKMSADSCSYGVVSPCGSGEEDGLTFQTYFLYLTISITQQCLLVSRVIALPVASQNAFPQHNLKIVVNKVPMSFFCLIRCYL